MKQYLLLLQDQDLNLSILFRLLILTIALNVFLGVFLQQIDQEQIYITYLPRIHGAYKQQSHTQFNRLERLLNRSSHLVFIDQMSLMNSSHLVRIDQMNSPSFHRKDEFINSSSHLVIINQRVYKQHQLVFNDQMGLQTAPKQFSSTRTFYLQKIHLVHVDQMSLINSSHLVHIRLDMFAQFASTR